MPVRTRRSFGGGATITDESGIVQDTASQAAAADETQIVQTDGEASKKHPARRRNKKRKSRSGRAALGDVDANQISGVAANRASKRTKRTKRTARSSSSSSSSSSSTSSSSSSSSSSSATTAANKKAAEPAPAAPSAPSASAASLAGPSSNKLKRSSRRSSRSAAASKAAITAKSSTSSKTSSSSSSSSKSSSSSASSTSSASKAAGFKESVHFALLRLEAQVDGINHGSTIPQIIKEVGGSRKLTQAQARKATESLMKDSTLFVDATNSLYFTSMDCLTTHESVSDIDAGHLTDPRYVTNYVTDIMSFRRSLELTSTPGTKFLDDFQTDITPNMRSILVDWLVEVAEEYHLHTESLFTAVNYVDRCLERSQIHRHKLQLLGCACMLLASKFEEIYAPAVDEFVYISDNTYTHEEIVRMESKVCKILNFKMTVSTTATFLPRFVQASQAGETLLSDQVGSEENKEKAPFFAKYVAELALQEYGMLKYKPSMIAAAAVSLSRRTCQISPVWHTTLEHYTGYQHGELRQCERSLRRLQRQASTSELRAIYEKYSSSTFCRVSSLDTYSGSLSPLNPPAESLSSGN